MDKKKKTDFRKGGGTFLEFSVTSLFLITFLMVIVGLFIKRYTIENINLAADQLARDVVVCESFSDAEIVIEERKQIFLDLTYVTDIDIQMDYMLGGNAEWHKGNYIQISYYVKLDSTLTLNESDYYTVITKMIENSGN